MVVIFPVINTAVVTTKCRELVIPQMWLMRTSSYPFSVSVGAMCHEKFIFTQAGILSKI